MHWSYEPGRRLRPSVGHASACGMRRRSKERKRSQKPSCVCFRRMSETFEGTSMGEYVERDKAVVRVRGARCSTLGLRSGLSARVGSVDDVRDDGEGGQGGRVSPVRCEPMPKKRAAITSEALEAIRVVERIHPPPERRSALASSSSTCATGVTLKETSDRARPSPRPNA